MRELRLNRKRVVPLHERLTVVEVPDTKRRADVAAALAAGITSDAATSTVDVLLRPDDMPFAAAPDSEQVADKEPDELTATAEHAAEQERALTAELDEARRGLDRDAQEDRTAAEAVVAGIEADLGDARERLRQVEETAQALDDRRTQAAGRRSELERRRAELAAELAEAERLDSDAIADALVAYRRLRSVKPRQSARAVTLADRWVAYRARLAGELDQGGPPPEYLVAPARAALDTARTALEEAEGAGQIDIEVDHDAVADLERAHRRVLEAEQRANLRPSRLSRRRLEAAQREERDALVRLAADDFGDYLRRIAPVVRAGGATPNLEAAREALADAEAVWEELHGGVPPMTDEEVEATLAQIREDAVELLGEDPGDDQLEERLRSHVENVVDVEWTKELLVEALAAVGIAADGDPEPFAEDWLSGAAERRSRVRELEHALAALDDDLAAMPREEAGEDVEDSSESDEGDEPDVVRRARREVEDGEGRLADARGRQQEALERADRAAAAEQRVQELSERLAEAQAVRAGAERAVTEQTERERGDSTGGSQSVDVVLYTLARLAAHRTVAGAEPLPLVVDDAFTALASDPRAAALGLLDRVSTTFQVLYLTGSDDVVHWAESLPAEHRLVHRH